MKPNISPQELRQLIRSRTWTTPTSGSASGYLQANLVMLPAEEAFNFLLFCVRNPKPCPILDVLEPGQTEPIIAPGADLCTDLPRYKIFENSEFKKDVEDVSDYFDANMVSFLLGCSFSFENAMVAAGLPIRNMEEDKNVSMYITNKACLAAGPFSAQLVVTTGGNHAADDPAAGGQSRAGDHPLSPDPRGADSSGRSPGNRHQQPGPTGFRRSGDNQTR